MNTHEILNLKVTIKSKVPSDIQSFKKLKKKSRSKKTLSMNFEITF